MGQLSGGKEIFEQGGEEVMVKISDLSKHGIKISEKFVKQYGEKLISKSKLDTVYAVKTAEEQQNALRGILGLRLNVSKASIEGVEKSAKLLNEKIKEGGIEQLASQESAEKFLENTIENISNVGDKETVQKIKAGAGEISKKAKTGIETMAGYKFITSIFDWIKNIFKIVFSFLNLDKLLVFGNTTKEVVEKLSPEKIEEVKNGVKNTIYNKYGETITPENKAKFEKSVESLSQEELIKLSEKLKKGELKFSDITSIIPNIFKEVLNKNQIEVIKNETKEKIVNSLKKEILEKYNIDLNLNDAKLLALENLVKENTKISDDNIGKFIEIRENKELKAIDLFGPSFDFIINSTSIFIGLITKGIVPISAFGLEFAETGATVVKLSANAMGISRFINLETFNKSIEKLGPEEKALMLGLIYRKGGLFLNIIGSIGETTSRMGIEFLTKTNVKSTSLIKSSLLNNYTKQIDNFEKIAQNLGDSRNVKGVLLESINHLNKIKENYRILDILKNSEGNTGKAIELLKKAKIDVSKLNSELPFDDFVKGFKNSFGSKLTTAGSTGSLFSKLGFGKNADLFKLNQKLENVAYGQLTALEGNFLSKTIGKLKELVNVGEISRLGERMVLHFESVEQAQKGISKLNLLANKFPDLIKGTLDKLPIIAVAGISASSDKPFFEEFGKQMKYLIPIVGPLLLIGESSIDWKTGNLKTNNLTEAGIGGALLGIDTIFLIKEMSLNGGIKAGGKYMIKPITDIYKLGRGGAELGYSVGKGLINGKSFSAVFKETIKSTKSIKRPKLKAIAVLALLGYAGYEITFSDNHLKEIFNDDGIMDKEKLKNEITKLSSEEKEMCLKYLIAETFGNDLIKNIGIKIKNDKIQIISNNENVQGTWLIDDKMLKSLELDPEISFKYIQKNQVS